MIVEQWNSNGETVWWNSSTVMVEQWNSEKETVLVEMCGGTVMVEECGGRLWWNSVMEQWNSVVEQCNSDG